MRPTVYILSAMLATLAAACTQTPTDNGQQPPPQSMSFKSGARYEYTSYATDAETGAQQETRTRTWTLINTSGSVHGRTGVAVYVDSVFSAGSLVNVADTVYLQQSSSSNEVDRYASLLPEVDVTGLAALDFGRDWRHEATLGAATASWLVGEAADTVNYDLNIPGLAGIKIGVVDSAVASGSEAITVGTASYQSTKTTHHLIVQISALIDSPIGRIVIPFNAATVSRTTWIAPSLGAVVREQREGTVVEANYQGSDYRIPIPGYYATMTAVLSAGG